MDVISSSKFKRQYKKLPVKIQIKFGSQVDIFRNNPRDRSLGIHPLQGDRNHLFSMNIAGDYRALFQWLNKETVQFREVDTHSQLYG